MTKLKKPDFKGIATAYDVRCADGLTIKNGAFKSQIGSIVTLFWRHGHDELSNVLGHAILTDHPKGIGVEGYFNDSVEGRAAKTRVDNRDIRGLSIWANDLIKQGMEVFDGKIREVSLVVAGKNPGAVIEEVVLHGEDGSVKDYFPEDRFLYAELLHEEVKDPDRTVRDVLNGMSEEKQNLFAVLLTSAMHGEDLPLESTDPEEGELTSMQVYESLTEEELLAITHTLGSIIEGDDDTIQQSIEKPGDIDIMTTTTNVFDNVRSADPSAIAHGDKTPRDIFEMAARSRQGTLRQNVLKHAAEYGFHEVGLLFPEFQEYKSGEPFMIQPDAEWVTKVMPKASKVPFQKVRTTFVDITDEVARARGYITATQKLDVVYRTLTRETGPTTLYTRTKLDNDDYIDIENYDALALLRRIQQIKWNEEAARAILTGDGRDIADPYKVREESIRPILTDDDLYTHKYQIAAGLDTLDIIDSFVYAQEHYQGSGSPTLFTSRSFVADMLTRRDMNDRRIYHSVSELANALMVKEIVTVPHFVGLQRTDTAATPVTRNVIGIMVNMADYAIGNAARGKARTYTDFDIDYNQHISLFEGRFSGALVVPKSAIVFEQALA